MNDVTARPVAEEESGTEVLVIEAKTALQVLTDPKEFDAFYARVKAETDKLKPDTSTAKGRDEIRAMARKVVTSKTAIDKAGLGLTEVWRKQTATVNEARSTIKAKLDELRDAVRKPLTDWEEADKAREDAVKAALARLQEAAVVSIEDTPETVEARLTEIAAVEITDDQFQEYAAAARAHQDTTAAALRAALVRLKKEAEDRAELDRLRQAETDRLAREVEEKAKADAKAAEEKKAEEDRLAAEATAKAEEERKAKADADAKAAADKAAKDAAEETRLAEIKKADEARAEQQRTHDAALEEQRQQTARAEAETKRLSDEKAAADQKAEDERKAAEARQADREHRGKVMATAKEAIMALGGLKEDVAKKIVLAIVAGEVPAVTLSF